MMSGGVTWIQTEPGAIVRQSRIVGSFDARQTETWGRGRPARADPSLCALR